jgi:hypothetical protein
MKNTACDPCAQIIEREITAANHFSDWLKQQVQLGVREDSAPAQGLLMHLQRDLAALQGGLIPALPAAPKTDAAATARRQFRKVLEAQIDLARVAFEGIQKQRELGIESTTDALLAWIFAANSQLTFSGGRAA